ncbi:MAG: DNA polymerase I [Gammaproteobacteria bacterium]|nr:DNA polymerase I [Gammaproteobacteria bacterium]
MNRLLLVDGTAYLFRAYYALPAFTTADGRPTGALHGVVSMIQRLLREEPPDLLAFVMDAPGPTFRDEIYPEYKANRDVMPEDLREQIEPVVNVVEAMGVPLLRIGGVEADDVIGTLAAQAREEGLDTLISTTDKDFAQLVGPHVRLVNWTNNRVMDSAAVEEKFGVPPERIRDYLALAGDTSDNIPGVRGVGPKTAAKWLQSYGSLAGVKENAAEIRGKAGETLRTSFADVDLSLELATIREDVPLDLKPHDLRLRAPDMDALETLCTTFELNTFLRSLRQSAPAAPKQAEYATILNSEQLEECLARLRDAPAAGLSVEASGENPMELRLAGLALSTGDGEGAYVPLAPRDLTEGAVERSDGRELLGGLKGWLEDAGAQKVGHNLKFVSHALANHGIELAGGAGDTMLESYVLNSTAIAHDFDKAVKRYLELDCISSEDVFGKGRGKLSPAQAPLQQVTPYAAQKADYALRLHRLLIEKLDETPVLNDVLGSMEMPLSPVLARMERVGVLVDAKVLAAQSQELAEQLRELQDQAFKQAGSEFNLGSPKQLGDVLFNQLGLEPVRRTSTGQPSTSESVLHELATVHDLPGTILKYRNLAKLKTGYTDALPGSIDPHTGRVHTSYQQAVAATGRLSSIHPNLQNIPARTGEGRRIRQAFVAPDGRVLMSADYSQIELRIMAQLSGDEGLRKAFSEDMDVHRATAAEVFDTPPDSVSADQRRAAKAINFGLIYGMSPFGLARQLGVTRAEAQEYVNHYFTRYPGVQQYMERTRKQAHEQGWVETLFGRRLYLPDIRARDFRRRSYAERSAINAPMQGTAADIIKRAMILIDEWLQPRRDKARLIMQVHDELVFECEQDFAEELAAEVTGMMAGAASLEVPLKVDLGQGPNWDAAH